MVRSATSKLRREAGGSESAWSAIEKQIARFAAYEDDWDAMDGVPPSQLVIASLRELVAKLQASGASAPSSAYAVGDGEVGLRWKTEAGFASASFLADGTFLAYARDGGLPEPFSLTVEWRADLDVAPYIAAIQAI